MTFYADITSTIDLELDEWKVIFYTFGSSFIKEYCFILHDCSNDPIYFQTFILTGKCPTCSSEANEELIFLIKSLYAREIKAAIDFRKLCLEGQQV